MTREELTDRIRAAARDNRLSCERAHDLAREVGVSLTEIGAVCNELGIRISQCQLGCF